MNPKKQPKIKVDDEILSAIYYYQTLDDSLWYKYKMDSVSKKLAKLLNIKVTKKGLKELKERLGVE